MLSISHYQRNAHQTHTEVTSHTGQNGHHESLQTINTGEGMEQRERSSTVGGSANW